MTETTVLVDLKRTTIKRDNQEILRDISVQICSGQCWAIVGPIGSGKTTLLQALAGQIPLPAGKLTRNAAVAFVSFREESRQFSYGTYFYQQRYQATMSDDAPLLRTYLQIPESSAAVALVDEFGLAPLLDLSLLKLSNGQTRKARIVKALLQEPPLLLLDNPFVGLDTASRDDLTTWLSKLIRRGSGLVLVSDPENIPSFITHVLNLTEGLWAGPRAAYTAPVCQPEARPLPLIQTPAKSADFSEVFQLQNVTVCYGQQLILDNLSWTVRAGERWALVGPNGVGKSVLLSLLYGDHPQAYANDVRVFGHRRGKGGESIWDVKRRIGFVSPELHLYFPQHLTAREVILTGLTDTMAVPRAVSAVTETDLAGLAHYFTIDTLLSRPFRTLSTGEQRLVLLIRALIKNPPVLLVDEPFQALDSQTIQLARKLFDSLATTSMLFITHDRAELPESVKNRLELHKGGEATCFSAC